MLDGIKVLLIEDDTAVRIGSVQALQLAGFAVESFESAERAVAHIKPGMPAVVVSDVKLPGMDGLGLLRYVVDVERDLPVILVTGHGDITMAVQAMRPARNAATATSLAALSQAGARSPTRPA